MHNEIENELDNPIASALCGTHRTLARTHGLALRYPSDVSPLSGLRRQTPAAFADLRALAAPGESIALFGDGPLDIPADWTLQHADTLNQMIYRLPARPARMQPPPLLLQEADVPDMLALTAATQPGPFLYGTIRMGSYFGIRADDGRLAALCGTRLAHDRFTEISAVCTDPAFSGKGHASALIMHVAAQIVDAGKLPILHVRAANPAIRLYEKLGFETRRTLNLTVVTPMQLV